MKVARYGREELSASCVLKEIAERVSLATGTPVNTGQVSRVLGCLRDAPSFWSLSENTDLPLPILSAVLSEFRKAQLGVQNEGSWALTETGVTLADQERLHPYRDNPCPACRGKAMNLVAYRDLMDRFRSAVHGRPQPLKNLDQGYVTEETIAARVALMESRGDLVGRDIFILGDDDLLSIAIGLMGAARRVLVAEADPRLVAFISEVSDRLNLRIETAQYNAVDPLPDAWLAQFDTFETDPVEAETGFKLFLRRCFATLRPSAGAGYFGLTRREASLNKWRRLQAFLLDCGFAITEMIHDFNEYEPWAYHGETPAAQLGGFPPAGMVWYKSTQFRVERVADVPMDNSPYEGPVPAIYDDPEQSTK